MTPHATSRPSQTHPHDQTVPDLPNSSALPTMETDPVLPKARIQWELVLLAASIVYACSQVSIPGVISQLASSASQAFSSFQNIKPSEPPANDGKTHIILINSSGSKSRHGYESGSCEPNQNSDVPVSSYRCR